MITLYGAGGAFGLPETSPYVMKAEVFLRMLEGIHRYEDRGWPISAWRC